MPGQDFTTTALLKELRRLSFLPSAAGLGGDTESLLLGLDNMLRSRVASIIKGVHEDYFVATVDVPTVSGQLEYALPERAIAGTLRAISVINASGVEVPLVKRRVEDLALLPSASPGLPLFYYFTDSSTLALYPAPNAVLTLRLRCEVRPSRLVLPAACCTVVSASSTVVRLSTPFPAGLLAANSAGAFILDFVRARPNFSVLGMDAVPSAVNISTGDVTYAAGVLPTAPRSLVAGDWACLAGEAPVTVGVQPEAHELLCQLTATTVLTLDPEREQASASAAERLRLDFLALITPRSEGNVESIRPDTPWYGGSWRGRARGEGYT